MNKAINKLADVVETRDLPKSEFKLIVDPDRIQTMTLDQLQQVIKNARLEFKFDETEVRSLFLNVTKKKNPAGIKIDMQTLTNVVYESVKAGIIE